MCSYEDVLLYLRQGFQVRFGLFTDVYPQIINVQNNNFRRTFLLIKVGGFISM